MRYGHIDGIDMPVSRIFLGAAVIPENPNGWLNAMLGLGVNAIDTARVYDYSEDTLGAWFEACGTRDRVMLLSKCGHPLGPIRRVNAKAMRSDLEKSLRALHTDYIDLYLLHRDDESVPVGEIVETFNDMKVRGQIRAFGGSNWTHRRIEAANEYAYKHDMTPFAASSPNFSLAEQVNDPWGGNCVSLSDADKAKSRDWYRESQLPAIAYSSLARGLFSGRLKSKDAQSAGRYLDKFAMRGYACAENFERLRRCEELARVKGVTVSQIALAWVFHQGINVFAIVNTSSPERMKANIDALSIALSAEECQYLDLQ